MYFLVVIGKILNVTFIFIAYLVKSCRFSIESRNQNLKALGAQIPPKAPTFPNTLNMFKLELLLNKIS